jgi:hypothetical protein
MIAQVTVCSWYHGNDIGVIQSISTLFGLSAKSRTRTCNSGLFEHEQGNLKASLIFTQVSNFVSIPYSDFEGIHFPVSSTHRSTKGKSIAGSSFTEQSREFRCKSASRDDSDSHLTGLQNGDFGQLQETSASLALIERGHWVDGSNAREVT